MGRRRGRRAGAGARDGGRDVRGRRATSLERRLRRRAARGERERENERVGRGGGRRLGTNGAGVSTRVFQRVEGGDVRHAGERGEGDDDVERGRGRDVGRGVERGCGRAAQGGGSGEAVREGRKRAVVPVRVYETRGDDFANATFASAPASVERRGTTVGDALRAFGVDVDAVEIVLSQGVEVGLDFDLEETYEALRHADAFLYLVAHVATTL